MSTTWDYNSGNYYLNITFLPFLEVNYRCTFIKVTNGKFNQDRSFAVRGRVLRESKHIPALVVGANDIYTSGSGKGNQYFGAMYGVTSKNLGGIITDWELLWDMVLKHSGIINSQAYLAERPFLLDFLSH